MWKGSLWARGHDGERFLFFFEVREEASCRDERNRGKWGDTGTSKRDSDTSDGEIVTGEAGDIVTCEEDTNTSEENQILTREIWILAREIDHVFTWIIRIATWHCRVRRTYSLDTSEYIHIYLLTMPCDLDTPRPSPHSNRENHNHIIIIRTVTSVVNCEHLGQCSTPGSIPEIPFCKGRVTHSLLDPIWDIEFHLIIWPFLDEKREESENNGKSSKYSDRSQI